MLRKLFRIIMLPVIAVAIVVGLFSVISGVFCLDEALANAKQDKLAHLESHVDGYLKIRSLSGITSNAQADVNAPKAVFVCLADNENESFGNFRKDHAIDSLTLKLPTDLFPERADTVTHVVHVEWGGRYIGDYDNGVRGMQEICRIVIFDALTGKALDQHFFEGEEPPYRTQKVSGRQFGLGCSDEIVQYVSDFIKVPK